MSLFLMIKLQWYCNNLSHVFSAFKLSLWWYVNILTWRPSHFCHSSFDHHTLLYFLVLLAISCNTQLNPHKWWQHHLLMVEALFIDHKTICFCVNFNILRLFPHLKKKTHHSSEVPVMFDALPTSVATKDPGAPALACLRCHPLPQEEPRLDQHKSFLWRTSHIARNTDIESNIEWIFIYIYIYQWTWIHQNIIFIKLHRELDDKRTYACVYVIYRYNYLRMHIYIYKVSSQHILLYIYIYFYLLVALLSIYIYIHIYIYIFLYDIQLAQKYLLKLRDGRRKGADQPPKSARINHGWFPWLSFNGDMVKGNVMGKWIIPSGKHT